MKRFNTILIILVIFLKTGNVLSYENIFNVNNIEITKKANISNEDLAKQAIKKAYKDLLEKILLQKDIKKISNLDFSLVKELVSYYQVFKDDSRNNYQDTKVKYNISFDKEKLHELFFKNSILYSEILDKEIFLLPILKDNEQYYIYNNNFFYEKWDQIGEDKLIEFILPLENIEVIQKINSSNNNLLDIDLRNLFNEYEDKNLALVIIEYKKSSDQKVFIRTRILGKNINKNILIKTNEKNQLSDVKIKEEIIRKLKEEIENIIKSQNLIDVRTPSFVNVRISVNKKNNLVELNKRLKKIESIENIYVQQLNNKYVFVKLKYFGKLNKIIKQLSDQNILLQFSEDQWSLKIS